MRRLALAVLVALSLPALAVAQGSQYLDFMRANMPLTGGIFTGPVELRGSTYLSAENLTNGALTAGTSWTATADFALAANAATYTHSAGSGTFYQTSAAAAVPWATSGINGWFVFTYTVSAVTGAPTCTVTTDFALAAQGLTEVAGTYTVTYQAKATTVGNFTVSCTSGAAATITFDSLSLKKIVGPSLNVHGAVLMSGNVVIPAGKDWNQDTYFGVNAGVGNTGAYFTGVGNATGSSNTGAAFAGVGYNVGYNNSGASFTGTGSQAGYNNSGAFFTGVGSLVGYNNSGASFTGTGYRAGYAPAGVTANANTTGAQNTFLGVETGSNSTTQYNNATTVGYRALHTASNQVSLGNSSVTEVLMGAGTARATVGSVLLAATAFAALGTPGNGTLAYCSDCTIANPCAGAGTGALAKRLNGVWVCN